RTGRSDSCEKRIDERMRVFTRMVYAECMENEGRFLPAIERALAGFDQEKTWLFPAHDPGLENFRGKGTEINICSSALAWNIATAAWWLGEKLSPAARQLVAENLERRIFTPFESTVKTGRPRTRCLLNTANHNSVTIAGITGCAMAQIESAARRAYFAAAGEKFIQNYVSGFTPDGYCAEGVGYWNYGFGRYTLFAETLRRASGGRVDCLADNRIRTIAMFGRRTEVQNGVYPTYSDSFPGEKADADLMGFLSRHYGWGLQEWEAAGANAARRPREHLFLTGIFDDAELSKSGPIADRHDPAPLRDFFPDGGLLICRPGRGSSNALAVAIKGGHNGEPHNHNDVGSFIVVAGNQPLLADPGAEVYTSRTFSRHRYRSNVLNSFGHSVPRVAGKLQSTGRNARAAIEFTDFKNERDILRIDLASAYDVAELSRLTRTFIYSRDGNGQLEVVDEVSFTQPRLFETALITFAPSSEYAPGHFRIGDDAESILVEITSEKSEFRVTTSTIEEELPDGRIPTRLAIELVNPIDAAKVKIIIRTDGMPHKR
ncbi:MAG: heparinase II/III family protein, partial [Pirellulales bacterium]